MLKDLTACSRWKVLRKFNFVTQFQFAVFSAFFFWHFPAPCLSWLQMYKFLVYTNLPGTVMPVVTATVLK